MAFNSFTSTAMTHLLLARDPTPIPVDPSEVAAWVSQIKSGMYLAVVLVTIVVYDASKFRGACKLYRSNAFTRE